ncbi:MAG: D-alanine--D-alanine ligase [Lentisphaeria bacterium]
MIDSELSWNKVHFVGIGGVGMAGLATILAERKVAVSGSDMIESPYTRQVESRGGKVSIGHRADNLPAAADLVVYSAAVPDDNPELVRARRNNIRCIVRGKFLAELAAAFPCVIAVAGSHGKTTTAALTAHILKQAGLKPAYMIGGEVAGWSASAAAGESRILVTEVDESDGTQAFMDSSYAVVTNVEDDHCWNLGGLEALEDCFRTFADKAEHLIAWGSDNTTRLFGDHRDAVFMGADELASEMALRIPGDHNRINAGMAIAAAEKVGIPKTLAINGANSFPGVKRRMAKHFSTADEHAVVIEDYAHHPTELNATLNTLRKEYPDHKLVAVFQPHRFERVKRYAQEFSHLLGKADEAIVVKPFAAWLQDGGAVNPESIAANIQAVPASYWNKNPEALGTLLADNYDDQNVRPTVFAILGAGDVCKVIPPLKAGLVSKVLDKLEQDLQKHCRGCVVHRLGRWSDYTTLGVGEARPLVVEPADVCELRNVLRIIRRHKLNCFFLGRGSNVVGTDNLHQEVIIRLHGPTFTSWSRHGRFIRVGTGVAVQKLISELTRMGRIPAEAAPLAWIPGAVGGAVRMNAGAEGAEIGQYVDRVTGVTVDGSPWSRRGSEIQKRYRDTDIPPAVCLTEILFQFGTDPSHKAAAVLDSSRKQRKKKQPRGRTAGCVFRNAGEAPAGRLLEAAGCKGLQVGNCRVSKKHANFIVARRGATEADFVTLARLMQQRVMKYAGIVLQPEVVFVNRESRKALETNVEAPHVAVLQGGPSAEHDISMKSAAAVADALRAAGLRVTQVDVDRRELPELPVVADVVFPVLHGTFGEDGGIQQLLEEKGLPYVGSGPRASADIMSKAITKQRLSENQIPTPAFRVIKSRSVPPPEDLKFPLVVKPVSQGSTYGLTLLRKPSGWWKRALKAAFAVDTAVMVEEYIEGTEITVGVVNGKPLPVIEIEPPAGRIFDFDAKYDHKRGHTHYHCPPIGVSNNLQKKARETAVQVYEILGARHMLRVDIILDKKGTPWVLEANSIPGFTATSLLPMAAREAGITFPELCAGLVLDARRKGGNY